MSPPANGKRAFTYVRLQCTDRAQCVHRCEIGTGVKHPNFTSTYSGVNACLAQCPNSVLNAKVLVSAFNCDCENRSWNWWIVCSTIFYVPHQKILFHENTCLDSSRSFQRMSIFSFLSSHCLECLEVPSPGPLELGPGVEVSWEKIAEAASTWVLWIFCRGWLGRKDANLQTV